MEDLVIGLAEILLEIAGHVIFDGIANKKASKPKNEKPKYEETKKYATDEQRLSVEYTLPKELIKQLPTHFTSKALYLMILLYLYYENDGKFSKDEKNKIKEYLKKEEFKVGPENYKILKKIANKRPSKRVIRKFIDHQNIHVITVESMLIAIRSIVSINPDSLKELDALELELI
jgi:hypothetical protein